MDSRDLECKRRWWPVFKINIIYIVIIIVIVVAFIIMLMLLFWWLECDHLIAAIIINTIFTNFCYHLHWPSSLSSSLFDVSL